MKKSSKILAGVLMTAVLATGAGMLSGCGETPNASVLGSTTDIYGFAGATTGMLANNPQIGAQMMAAADASANVDEIKNKLNSAISQTLDGYMNVFDSVVGGNKPVNVIDGTSDKQEYKHKLTISASSIDGQTTTCVLYFNETLKDNKEVDVNDSDKEERETVLEGELYLNDSQTPLYVLGSKEHDPEDNEMEIEFEARLSKNDDNYRVVFNQEREEVNGKIEEEYVFTLQMGEVKQSFSFEIEKNAQGKIEVEYEQEIGGAKINFEIEKEANNSITISTSDFGLPLEINVAVEQGTGVDEGKERYVYTIPVWPDFRVEGSLR